MKILVTGSSGHLGEALVRTLRDSNHTAMGLDLTPSPFTDQVGSIVEREFVRRCVDGADVIVHTATLHKPHVGTHSRQEFVATNVTGTLNLLEEAAAQGCRAFIFTSTTSTFGDAMKPAPGEPAVWVTEQLRYQPKNIYGVTKTTAEDLCALFHRNTGLPCIVLKTSRFFPEEDDNAQQRSAFTDANLKVNELLHRRADIADIVSAHVLAIERAEALGFARLIVTATTPFQPSDAAQLALDPASVVARYVPEFVQEYQRRGWRMMASLGRVYDNSAAREALGWSPRYDFRRAIESLAEDRDFQSELARTIGSKGYHNRKFEDGPFPVTDF